MPHTELKTEPLLPGGQTDRPGSSGAGSTPVTVPSYLCLPYDCALSSGSTDTPQRQTDAHSDGSCRVCPSQFAVAAQRRHLTEHYPDDITACGMHKVPGKHRLSRCRRAQSKPHLPQKAHEAPPRRSLYRSQPDPAISPTGLEHKWGTVNFSCRSISLSRLPRQNPFQNGVRFQMVSEIPHAIVKYQVALSKKNNRHLSFFLSFLVLCLAWIDWHIKNK